MSRDAELPDEPAPPAESVVLLHSWQAMGSPWGVWMRIGPQADSSEGSFPQSEQKAFGTRLEEECRRLEGLISRFSPRSEVFRFNRDAARESVLLDRETAALIEFVAFACDFTVGAFNPVRRRSGATSGPPPSWSDVAFDAARRTFRFLRDDVELDLGAIGKGWALERLEDELLELPRPPVLLSAGGSSWLALGGTDADDPWPVPLDDPWADRATAADEPPLALLPLRNAGLSVSWIRPAAPLPSTEPSAAAPSDLWGADGAPLQRAQSGCVVRHPSPTFAEVLSTALLAAEEGPRQALLARLQGHPVCAVGWLRPPESSPRVEWLLPWLLPLPDLDR